jgi:glycosyltransferase involved in cell wall biosynthesis
MEHPMHFRKQVTLRLGTDVIEYFKGLAKETGVPYQNLINLYLREPPTPIHRALHERLERSVSRADLVLVTTAAHERLLAEKYPWCRIERIPNGFDEEDFARDAGARLLKRASYQYLLENTLQIMDAAAVSLCQNEAIPIRIFNIRVPGNIRRVVLGEDVGSTVADS